MFAKLKGGLRITLVLIQTEMPLNFKETNQRNNCFSLNQ